MGPFTGVGQPAQPQPQRPSFFSRAGELIGGEPSSALSPEQNAQAQREAILNASLMALLAGGRGDPTAAGLAQALLAGRASGANTRQALEAATAAAQMDAQRQQLSQMVASSDRAQLMQALAAYLGAGDMESAKMVIEALKTLPSVAAGADKQFGFQVIPETGQVLRTNPYTGEAQVLDVGLQPKPRLSPSEEAQIDRQRRQALQQLSDDYRAETGRGSLIAEAYGRILAVGTQPSAAGDLALIFNYMKMLDPGSVVRESEFANAQNAGGVPDRIRAMYNRVLSGERLSEDQRKDFIGRSRDLAVATRRQLRDRRETFVQRAYEEQATPEQAARLFYDPFEQILQAPEGSNVPPPGGVAPPGTGRLRRRLGGP